MRASKKLINEIIAKVTASVFNTDSSRFQLARDLHWAKHVVVWKLTEYKTWKRFCGRYINMGLTTIYRYVNMIEMVEKYKYTDAQCLKIIKAIGMTQFEFGLSDINRKMAVVRFIKTFGRGPGEGYRGVQHVRTPYAAILRKSARSLYPERTYCRVKQDPTRC